MKGEPGKEGLDIKELKEKVKELKSVVSEEGNQLKIFKEQAKEDSKQMEEVMNKKLEQKLNKKFNQYTEEVENTLQSNVDDPKLKAQLVNRKYIASHKNKKIQRIGSVMKTKSKDSKLHKNVTTCTGGTKWTSTKLVEKKKIFCKGSNRLDVSNRNVKNVAIYYLKDQISSRYTEKHMISVKQKIRYDVVDTSCPSKLFDAKDISIQQIAMDTLGKEKEWVAVVHLNTEDSKGYLQSELPYCKVRKYLIGADVKVKAYIDNENCCDGLRDYHKCIDAGCEKKLIPMNDVKNRHFSRDVQLIGSDYTIKDTHHYKHRRRLFASTGSSGSCANRL